ncbi:MAG: hypothetical protein HYU30_01490 [Chloroflexi bacterium]|nr:hypothetical protein [Chloroflexota bacterium]
MQTLTDLQPGTYDSPYLCGDCRNPLYVDVISKREVCLNPKCLRWPADYSSVADPRPEASPKIYRELKEQYARIEDTVRRCNLASLRRFLHEERRNLGLSFLKDRGMRISEWHAISELLVITQRQPSRRLHTTGDENEGTFAGILTETSAWAARMRLMEDLRTGRYAILRHQNGTLYPPTFALKYLLAVRSSERAMGLVERIEQLDESPFEYEHIETAATPSPPPGTTELADHLEALWPFTLHFRHALRSHWRTSQLYKHEPELVDFSVLAGYWGQCPDDETCRIPADKEKDEVTKLDAHLRKFSGGKVTAADFVKRYIDCEEQAPVIVLTPEGWLFDKTTLLLFILYLQGEPRLVDKNTARLNEPLLDRMRGRAGCEFELWLRAQLRAEGFRGPDAPVKVRYEYDLLMISDAKNTIVLSDAKYRDVNPSSVTGENLLAQELLAHNGLLAEAKRQEDRLAFFIQNQGSFQKFLTPQHPWASYQVRSFLLTKFAPLISRYKNTAIVSAREFLTSLEST